MVEYSSTSLMELPKCPTHGSPMHYRVPRTNEQRFCGTWYDCDTPGCKCSTLLPSAELRDFLAKMQRKEVRNG